MILFLFKGILRFAIYPNPEIDKNNKRFKIPNKLKILLLQILDYLLLCGGSVHPELF
jgi:hypothetical protein